MMSIAKNYIYNVIYQVFILVVPLITIPYVSRVLGSSGVGLNAYTNSLIQYFILFGTIGIALYGNRSIAYVRDNKTELSKTFWSIFILKVITICISYAAFLIFLMNIHRYHSILLIQSIYIVSAAIDITWLYMGLEDFKKTVVRNIIVKIIGTVSIFIFVRNYSDLWKYVLILAMSEFIGQFTLWFYLSRTVKLVKIHWQDIKMHIFPALTLFLPQIAIQIYAVLNKTMLGYMTTTNEVGYFDNADRIVKVVLAVVTAMGIVMLPRISNTFAKGETDRVKEYLHKSIDFSSYLSIPMMFGLAATAQGFTSWYFPTDFSKTGMIICIISPVVVAIAWSNVIGIQFMLPTGKNREFTISVIVGALVNFALNIILIPTHSSIGTAIATVIAEFSVTIVQFIYIKRDLSIKQIIKVTWKYLIAGLLMYLIINLIGRVLNDSFLVTVIQVVAGILVYFTILFILRSELNSKIFNQVVNIMKYKQKNDK